MVEWMAIEMVENWAVLKENLKEILSVCRSEPKEVVQKVVEKDPSMEYNLAIWRV